MDEQFDFTELGEQLRGPGGAEVARQALARLDQLQFEVEARLARGLPTAEYDANRRLATALAAARRVMIDFSTTRALEPGGGGMPQGSNGD